MIVLKFGGSSVGTAQRMKNLAPIIANSNKKIVVLSAMAGTTDMLEKISTLLYKKEKNTAKKRIGELEGHYKTVANELFDTEKYLKKAIVLISSHFDYIREFSVDVFSILQEKAILAQGELISSALLHYYLSERKISSILLPALNFMRIDKDNEPDHFYIKESINRELNKYPQESLFITQGYICRNAFGEVDNLKRGGSDYTASLIGVAVGAEEIQIWTDTDGIRNNDPRFVENTAAIRSLSFSESAELAYFGAKILHPTSILPAQTNNILVRLKNTLKPEERGTLISHRSDHSAKIKAVAAKDNITVIKIKSGRMLMAYGFLRKIFEIFEIYKTAIDIVTTSEVAVSLTIDDDSNLENILFELKKFGYVEVDKELSIICIVGNFSAETSGLASKVFKALEEIPVRMISYGGSNYNITVLVRKELKVKALNLLSKKLF